MTSLVSSENVVPVVEQPTQTSKETDAVVGNEAGATPASPVRSGRDLLKPAAERGRTSSRRGGRELIIPEDCLPLRATSGRSKSQPPRNRESQNGIEDSVVAPWASSPVKVRIMKVRGSGMGVTDFKPEDLERSKVKVVKKAKSKKSKKKKSEVSGDATSTADVPATPSSETKVATETTILDSPTSIALPSIPTIADDLKDPSTVSPDKNVPNADVAAPSSPTPPKRIGDKDDRTAVSDDSAVKDSPPSTRGRLRVKASDFLPQPKQNGHTRRKSWGGGNLLQASGDGDGNKTSAVIENTFEKAVQVKPFLSPQRNTVSKISSKAFHVNQDTHENAPTIVLDDSDSEPEDTPYKNVTSVSEPTKPNVSSTLTTAPASPTSPTCIQLRSNRTERPRILDASVFEYSAHPSRQRVSVASNDFLGARRKEYSPTNKPKATVAPDGTLTSGRRKSWAGGLLKSNPPLESDPTPGPVKPFWSPQKKTVSKANIEDAQHSIQAINLVEDANANAETNASESQPPSDTVADKVMVDGECAKKKMSDCADFASSKMRQKEPNGISANSPQVEPDGNPVETEVSKKTSTAPDAMMSQNHILGSKEASAAPSEATLTQNAQNVAISSEQPTKDENTNNQNGQPLWAGAKMSASPATKSKVMPAWASAKLRSTEKGSAIKMGQQLENPITHIRDVKPTQNRIVEVQKICKVLSIQQEGV